MTAPIFMGMQGFVWFFGFVESINDPDKLGRVQVRMIGLSTKVKTEDLHWAAVGMPVTSASHKGIGQSPTGISVGAMVMGFFMDGEHQQQPMVMFTWYGMAEGDISGFMTGDKTVTKGDATFEPENPAKPKYPHNKTLTTEAGHLIEYDDTPGAERLHFYHKSGSYDEVGPDGQRVIKTVGDSYTIDLKDRKMYVKGDLTIQVDGDVDATITGKTTIVGTDDIEVTAPHIILNG